MNDKELADKVLALGVGSIAKGTHHPVGFFPPMSSTGTQGFMYANMFVRDWRVAGALMEKCWGKGYRIEAMKDACRIREKAMASSQTLTIARGESNPRAIIEACVEALNEC